MMASAVAAQAGASVLLLERNSSLGRKLLITGKGRCNLTNMCSVQEVLDNIPTGSRFLHSALNAFSPNDTFRLFERLGVPLKTERGGRVFPQSDSSADVVQALRRYMDETGVKQKHARVQKLIAQDGSITAISSASGDIICGAAILATGGISYPSTGSNGDGHAMARDLGHNVTPLRASLVPLEAERGICARMQGLTLKNVRMLVYSGSAKPVFDDFGEVLFTHFGLSGPLALSASAHMRDAGGGLGATGYYAIVDLKPALDDKMLDLRILRDFDKYINRCFVNSLTDLLPKAMIPIIVEKSGIPPLIKVNSISRKQRMGLIDAIKRFRIGIDGKRPVEEAIVTSGGVDLREINPKTMESKLVGGLFFAGEIIDADAYTGGFNLQIAWSTAYAAGRAASQRAKRR